MFQPEHFPLRGLAYQAAVAKLRHVSYHNHKMLLHYAAEMAPRKWRDSLGRSQSRSFSYIKSPDEWHSTGAEEELQSAVMEVPVLALALVRCPQDSHAEFVVVSAYNGRTVAFCLPLLLPNAPWFRKWEVLPANLRAWLEGEEVFVLTTKSSAPLLPDPDGFCLRRQVDTDKLFAIYQNSGVIKPHFKAEVGDAAWQMTYATGYHHHPMAQPKFVQLVGENHYSHGWPQWRHLGWLPVGKDELAKHESFFLFYEAAAMQLFVNRLLQHGLLFGGMKAVDPSLPLATLYCVFLEGGESDPFVAARDPLGLRTDAVAAAMPPPSSSESHYTPQELNPPLPGGSVAEELSSNSTGETVVPAGLAAGDGAGKEDAPATQEPMEEGSNDKEEKESSEAVLLLCDTALEKELNQEDAMEPPPAKKRSPPRPDPTQRRLLELAQNLEGPGKTPSGKRPRPLFGPDLTVEVLPAPRASLPPPLRPPPPSRPPPPRTPPPPRSSAVVAAQQQQQKTEEDSRPTATGANADPMGPRRNSAAFPLIQIANSPAAGAGGDEAATKEEPTTSPGEQPPLYGPQDVRSRLFPRLANPAAFAEYNAIPLPPVALCERDKNMAHSAQVNKTAGTEEIRAQHPSLRFAPLATEVEQGQVAPIDESRLGNLRLSPTERRRNPYVLAPLLDARCDFCSAKHCSRFVAGTNQPNCLRYREQVTFAPTRRICDYRRCLAPHEHHTVACPYLHRRCSRCGCRGHDTADECDLRNAAVMARLRADFEEHANCGLMTRRRFAALEWGFYPIPSLRPEGNFVSYRYLTDLPVLEAMAALQSLLLLPENIARAREHAPQPDEAPQGPAGPSV